MSKYIDLHDIANTVNDTNTVDNVQNTQHIIFNHHYCGILYFDKTFGRRGNKYYYKCVPYNKNVPNLLIAYEKKIGFSKKIENYYVQFKYSDIISKPPKGILVNNFGICGNDDEYFDYLMHANDLIVTHKIFKEKLHNNIDYMNISEVFEKYYGKVTFDESYIFSIDNTNTRDIDDAFSVKKTTFGYIVNVYISNVHIWIDHLELWDCLRNCFSSIYLPHKNYPMLPKQFTEKYCSLIEGQQRIVHNYTFIMDHNGNIIHFNISNKIINISKNFHYNDHELYDIIDYNILSEITKIKDPSISNHKDIIKYWMTCVCSNVGNMFNNGIFINKSQSITNIVENFNKSFYLISGDYLQVTSPIRRIIDIYNNIAIFDNHLLCNLPSFDFEYFNNKRKSKKKVENGCNLLNQLKDASIYSDLTHIHDDFFIINSIKKIIKSDTGLHVTIHRFNKDIKIV